MAVQLPEPVVRGRASLAHLDVRALEADLRERVEGRSASTWLTRRVLDRRLGRMLVTPT